MKKDNNGASEALSRIQWITKSAQFTEHQWIQLGDALLAFDDLINKHQSAQAKISKLENGIKEADRLLVKWLAREKQLLEAVKVLREGAKFYAEGNIDHQRDYQDIFCSGLGKMPHKIPMTYGHVARESISKADAILGQGDALPSLTMEINHGEFKIEGNPKIITNGCSVSLKNKGEK